MTVLQLALPMLLFAQPAHDESSLAALQQRAQATRISLTKDKGRKIDFVEKPIFRYTDELRHIEQAGIWVWTDRGRPAAAMKVEHYARDPFASQWLYCFTSLSPELVTAEWDGNPTFEARQPGVTWQPLDDKPAATRVARLVQMREIARRFSAELTELQEVHQMRLLPRPLCRYQEGLEEIEDGALFGFTGTGTNPDLMLLIELPKKTGWRFGFAGMTAAGLTVRMDDAVVWSFPSGSDKGRVHASGKGHVFDNLTYFVPKD